MHLSQNGTIGFEPWPYRDPSEKKMPTDGQSPHDTSRAEARTTRCPKGSRRCTRAPCRPSLKAMPSHNWLGDAPRPARKAPSGLLRLRAIGAHLSGEEVLKVFPESRAQESHGHLSWTVLRSINTHALVQNKHTCQRWFIAC